MAHNIVMLDSPKEDLFVCGYCKTIFTALQLFLDHKRESCTTVDALSDERDPFQIENTTIYSDNAPRNIAESSYHTTPHFGSGKESTHCKTNRTLEVYCKICAKTFTRSKSLAAHMKSHNGKPYQCLICGRCFSQSSHLKRHELTHKVWPTGLSETTAKSIDADTASYSCMFCDTILPSYGQFRIHLKKHCLLKKFKCVQEDCHNLFETIDLLLQHVASVHNNASYLCPLCNKMFHTLEDSAVHQQNHDKPCKTSQDTKQFKCDHCDAVFKKKDKLDLHLTTETHSKTCVHCNKTFASHKRLRLHLQIHKQDKPFQCNICNQNFSLKKYLSTHMAKHSDRSFTCSVCNYKFKRKDLLQRHLRTHQKKKMYKCPFKEALSCKMEFTRSDKLNLHVKNHTKQMTFNPKKSRKTKQNNSSTIEIMIVPLDETEVENTNDGT